MSMQEMQDRYRRIVTIDGEGTGETMTKHTHQFINARFKDSPSYRRANVASQQYPDIKEIDIRVVSVERMGTIQEAIFRPEEGLDIGSYLIFDNNVWLIYDSYLGTVSPKATIQKCNEIIKWRDRPTGVVHSIHVFSGASDLGSKAKQSRSEIPYNKLDVKEPTSQLFVYMESNLQTNRLGINDRLIVGDRPFRIVGKDATTLTQLNRNEDDGFNYGIVYFVLQLDTVKNYDDIDGEIAQNYGDGLEDWG